jgi:hypothetical protein
MDKWGVGDDTGSQETDGCPLTITTRKTGQMYLVIEACSESAKWMDSGKV